MKLKEYLAQPHINRADFAEKVNISPNYLSQIVTGYRNAGLCVAVRIEDATGGAVTCRDMVK